MKLDHIPTRHWAATLGVCLLVALRPAAAALTLDDYYVAAQQLSEEEGLKKGMEQKGGGVRAPGWRGLP